MNECTIAGVSVGNYCGFHKEPIERFLSKSDSFVDTWLNNYFGKDFAKVACSPSFVEVKTLAKKGLDEALQLFVQELDKISAPSSCQGLNCEIVKKNTMRELLEEKLGQYSAVFAKFVESAVPVTVSKKITLKEHLIGEYYHQCWIDKS
ncbi:MAG: hypothetical protein Q7K43_00250 [Candidatus Woesearchaeota archaeon]|nr:hypothetical protein [Candidatus Woesearchaeota archaeon]